MAEDTERKRRRRWHIAVFLAPAILVYTAIMILPLFGTLQLSLFTADGQSRVFAGLDNFRRLFLDPRWSASFWNALGNNLWFFIVHMLVQNPIGIALAALLSSPKLRFSAFYRTAIFIPTILSFVIVGFTWKLITGEFYGGFGTWFVIYVLGPIVGGVLASTLYRYVFLQPEVGEEPIETYRDTLPDVA